MNRRLLLIAACFTALGCGVGNPSSPRAMTLSQALTGSAEALELESPALKQELYLELLRNADAQAGQSAASPVLFPVDRDGKFVGAPSLGHDVDLLGAGTSPLKPSLALYVTTDRFAQARSDTLGGLSEQEAAELIGRSLAVMWHLTPANGRLAIERAAGAPWAAAYADGILRLNPSFVALAAVRLRPPQ